MALSDSTARTVAKLYATATADPTVKTVTAYVSPMLTVKLTRVGRSEPRRVRAFDFRLTTGRPNYRERRFIADCKKAGEQFPVRKLQIKRDPQRRARK